MMLAGLRDHGVGRLQLMLMMLAGVWDPVLGRLQLMLATLRRRAASRLQLMLMMRWLAASWRGWFELMLIMLAGLQGHGAAGSSRCS